MKMDLKGKTLTIVIDDVTKSIKTTAKMELSASSGGFQPVATVDGKVVKANVMIGWKR